MDNIISVPDLQKMLDHPNLIILDATIPKVALKESPVIKEKKVIQGTRFFDIKKTFSNLESKIPNTIPSAEQFEKECRNLGINATSEIVVYDDKGIYSSPRVWWLFKTMGHTNVKVLDGGLPEWNKANYQTVSQSNHTFELGDFEAKLERSAVVDFKFIQSNIKNEKALVIDARSADRFNSRVPEPRADLRSGNISGSINIPYSEVLENGKFKSIDKLKCIFSELKNETRPLVFSCGSGITACVISLASVSFLDNKKSIYDGSWTEYAQLTEG